MKIIYTTQEIKENTASVKVSYNASMDMYIVKDNTTGKQKLLEYRTGVTNQIVDKEKLLDELNGDISTLINVDMNIYKLLTKYDSTNGTDKAKEYLEIVTNFKNSRLQMIEDMQKAQIDIEYYLLGLYNGKMSLEERIEILNIANNACDKGIANTTKGIIVSVLENIDKWKVRKQKVKMLPEAKREKTNEQEKIEFKNKLIVKEENINNKENDINIEENNKQEKDNIKEEISL